MARLRVIDHGPDRLNASADSSTGYDGWIGIETRGSSSQRFPKKQYGVETRHADGSNRDASLLGLPSENDWVLHAPYSDKSLVRNALAFHLGRATGRYASRARFCELVLDGDYRGVYLLLESIKDDGDRVDLADTDSLGGGYIAKLDKRTGSDTGTWPSRDPATGQLVRYQFHDPEADELTAVQRREIERTFERDGGGDARPRRGPRAAPRPGLRRGLRARQRGHQERGRLPHQHLRPPAVGRRAAPRRPAVGLQPRLRECRLRRRRRPHRLPDRDALHQRHLPRPVVAVARRRE